MGLTFNFIRDLTGRRENRAPAASEAVTPAVRVEATSRRPIEVQKEKLVRRDSDCQVVKIFQDDVRCYFVTIFWSGFFIILIVGIFGQMDDEGYTVCRFPNAGVSCLFTHSFPIFVNLAICHDFRLI